MCNSIRSYSASAYPELLLVDIALIIAKLLLVGLRYKQLKSINQIGAVIAWLGALRFSGQAQSFSGQAKPALLPPGYVAGLEIIVSKINILQLRSSVTN